MKWRDVCPAGSTEKQVAALLRSDSGRKPKPKTGGRPSMMEVGASAHVQAASSSSTEQVVTNWCDKIPQGDFTIPADGVRTFLFQLQPCR